MPDYRIFSMGGRGRVVESYSATCADDKQACLLLENTLKIGTRAEVWSGTRFVAKLVLPSHSTAERPSEHGSND